MSDRTTTTSEAAGRGFIVATLVVTAVVVTVTVIGLAAFMPDLGGHAHGASGGGTSLGVAAPVADADRTVRISATDDLTYDPATIRVEVGEVVAFEVTNDGAAEHEFFLADPEMQRAHEDGMDHGAGEHSMPDMAHAFSLEPGETKSIAWRFATAGTTQFACHVPGHYAGGMVGTIVVT